MGLFSRLFRRKPDLPFEDRDDGVRWDAGDIAVCIADNWFEPDEHSPRVGQYFTVEGVERSTIISRTGCRLRATWLYFVGKSRPCESTAFRKVVADTEPAEEEFTARLFRRKPVGV